MSHVDGVDDGVGYGVYGKSSKGAGYGVYGESDSFGYGVYGKSNISVGVNGISQKGVGVVGGSGNSAGLYCNSSYDYAAVLNGKVKITGNLEKAGGSFKITTHLTQQTNTFPSPL